MYLHIQVLMLVVWYFLKKYKLEFFFNLLLKMLLYVDERHKHKLSTNIFI